MKRQTAFVHGRVKDRLKSLPHHEQFHRAFACVEEFADAIRTARAVPDAHEGQIVSKPSLSVGFVPQAPLNRACRLSEPITPRSCPGKGDIGNSLLRAGRETKDSRKLLEPRPRPFSGSEIPGTSVGQAQRMGDTVKLRLRNAGQFLTALHLLPPIKHDQTIPREMGLQAQDTEGSAWHPPVAESPVPLQP